MRNQPTCGEVYPSAEMLRESGSLEDAAVIAKGEITPIIDGRGWRGFRLQLAENVLKKFCYDVAVNPA